MSKIQIVDDEDNIIGHKERDDIDYATDIYRSTTLWLENSKGEVLIAQRKLTKDKDPGKWGPAVAGTMDEGETYESNIVKEVEEEIGLTGVGIEPVDKFKLFTVRKQFVQVFRAIVDKPLEDFTLQETEVEKLAWIPKAKLLEDVSTNPDKYVPSMLTLVRLFV